LDEPGDVKADLFLPLTLPPSRQPGQTASAVRKAFGRLGDTAWLLGALTLEDPHACYAPPSKLNEARRDVLEKLSAAWAACRAGRRAAIAAAWGLSPSGAPPSGESRSSALPAARWSIKLRADSPLLPLDALAGIDTLVLAVGHAPRAILEKRLADWGSLFAPSRLRLALPLITRSHELPELKSTLRALVQDGWNTWECADLAGCHLLGELGLKPVSSDWSLYALNRVAAAELGRLGIASHVLSPENSRENIRALSGTGEPPRSPLPAPELLVYQHTPLFISETAPCLPHADEGVTLTDRRGRTFVTQKIDGRWSTVWSTPFCLADRIADSGASLFRIDLSWSPDAASFPALIRSVLAGRLPPAAHPANFSRGLA
jgi:hypothetical protein